MKHEEFGDHIKVYDTIQRPQPDKLPDEWKPIMVGDLVERGLTAIGITKERVERLTRTEGKPGGCGCPGRKKWLNEVGSKVQIEARKKLLKVRDFYLGKWGPVDA